MGEHDMINICLISNLYLARKFISWQIGKTKANILIKKPDIR